MFETIKMLDKNLLVLINSHHTAFLDLIFWQLSENWPTILFVGVFGFFFYKKFKIKNLLAMLLGVAIVIACCDLSSNAIKHSVKRLRPTHNTELKEKILLVNNYQGGNFGFVSSHAANSFGILTYLLDIPAINKIHNDSVFNLPFISHTPLTPSVLISDNAFYGDLVEYNKIQVKETILADVSHRFNTVNRETTVPITYNLSLENTELNLPATTYTTDLGPRQEGYFYKAHYSIPLKEYSDYVEQGDIYTVGIPDYAVNLGDGRYIWRDLLDIGVYKSDDRTLDYPFLNGCHYIYNNICFSLRRQDPFNNWGLYHNRFPADPVGDRTTDKFNFNSTTNVC